MLCEEDYIGDCTARARIPKNREVLSADLPMELRVSHQCPIANARAQREPNWQVTHYEMGSTPAPPHRRGFFR